MCHENYHEEWNEKNNRVNNFHLIEIQMGELHTYSYSPKEKTRWRMIALMFFWIAIKITGCICSTKTCAAQLPLNASLSLSWLGPLPLSLWNIHLIANNTQLFLGLTQPSKPCLLFGSLRLAFAGNMSIRSTEIRAFIHLSTYFILQRRITCQKLFDRQASMHKKYNVYLLVYLYFQITISYVFNHSVKP